MRGLRAAREAPSAAARVEGAQAPIKTAYYVVFLLRILLIGRAAAASASPVGIDPRLRDASVIPAARAPAAVGIMPVLALATRGIAFGERQVWRFAG